MRVRIPTGRSILHSLRVERVPAVAVRSLVIDCHYLHSMPGVVRCCYAVHLGSEMVGACIFTAGARHAHHLLAGARPADVATLARFWMADDLPPNNESRVLALILRELRRERNYKLLVSFADPAVGHVGTIYQAAGWLYLGTTEPERYFELDGVRIHPRSASDRFGSNSVAHLRRTGVAIVAHKSPPKHRYAYVLDPGWRWRLSRQPQPHPKRGGQSPPARPSPGNENGVGGES
ncbi:MAG: Mom family adenine methylcarbamoylation protein [Thermoleophilia bacterium]